MTSYDFGMHRAGVLLHLLLLLLARRAVARRGDQRRVLLLGRVLAMGELRDHRVSHRQRKCARDYGCNVFSHFVWL